MADNRGTITQNGNILQVNNALVEEVSDAGRNTGFIIFSYSFLMPGGMASIERFRLNINRNTAVLNSRGLPMCLCDIRPGMWIDATFSSAVTRSIPPQSNAFLVRVVRAPQPAPQPPQPPSNVTTGRVLRADTNQNFLLVGEPLNPNRQTRFNITNNTVILSRNGVPIPLRFVLPGQTVTVRHANFQTASIPPQTTAFLVQVL